MPDYQQTKIYKIINNLIPDKIYYGSTTQKYLCDRMSSHRNNMKDPKMACECRDLFDIGKPIIVLVENYPCNSKDEKFMRERWYIENNDCVNKKIPIRTDAERKQISKDWEIKNKDKRTKQHKDYLSKNKDKINAQRRERTRLKRLNSSN